MRRCLTLSLLMLAAPVAAQDAPPPAQVEGLETATQGVPRRIRNLTLREGEKCPKPEGDEIIVCGKLDPDEQYRIPKEYREQPVVVGNNAWTNRAQTMMEVNRATLPNSCSAVGTGGQTGCNQQLIDQWQAWRREQQAAGRVP
jgi:hypothetical protein